MHRRDLMTFLCSSVLLMVLTVAGWRWLPGRTHELPIANASRADADGVYLSTDNQTTLDQLVFFHELQAVAEPVRGADVIFAGNSRSLFAFRGDTAKTFFSGRNCSWYHAGFPAESSLFTTHILENLNASPLLVIVNADDFFRNRISMMAKRTISTSGYGARKQYAESYMSYRLRNHLHQWLPHFPTLFCAQESMIVHRSVHNGAWQISSAIGNPARVDSVAGRSRATEEELRLAEDFQRWVTGVGGELVLTYVPKPVDDRRRARHIADHLGCRFIAPVLSDLHTLDGSHLDADSAYRFATAFYAELGQMLQLPQNARTGPALGLNRL